MIFSLLLYFKSAVQTFLGVARDPFRVRTRVESFDCSDRRIFSCRRRGKLSCSTRRGQFRHDTPGSATKGIKFEGVIGTPGGD